MFKEDFYKKRVLSFLFPRVKRFSTDFLFGLLLLYVA